MDMLSYFKNRSLKIELECPYFKGAVLDGKKACVKCGDNTILAWFKGSEDRDLFIKEKCKGDLLKCKSYIYRQLEKRGVKPKSYWSFENYQRILIRLIKNQPIWEGGEKENICANCTKDCTCKHKLDPWEDCVFRSDLKV